MMRYLLSLLLIIVSLPLWAEGTEGLVLANAPIDRSDMQSVMRGARFFATTCMSCHTLIYLKYDKLAHDAGITLEKMPTKVTTWPFGVTPPDLSLEANVRGVDWIYTYLHSFYQDTTRPTGFNNLLVPNTAMIDIVVPYQGDQVLVKNPMKDLFHQVQWYDAVKLVKQGTMTPEQFDATIADLVNFLAYAAEPYHNEQQAIGIWVLLFLAILFVMMYLLKREYWKDVKKHKR